jgi:outer membrane protein assembly factor BamB
MGYYLLGWGTAQAPMLYEDKLIYCQDDDLGSFILALDKKTGNKIWRTPREDMLAGYSVPVIVTAGGRTDVVVAGSGKMQGYDPNDGKLIWTCNSLLRTIMVSPVVQDDMIYISLKSFGDTNRVLKYALLEWKDTNQDKKLSKTELEPAFYEKFDKADANHDGFLEGSELDHAFQSPKNMAGGGKIVQAIRGGGRGDVTKTHLVWNNTVNVDPSDIASPLLYEGKLFLVKNGGMTAAYDAKDGKEIWSKKRIDNPGNYYASPVAAEGKVYVTGEAGAIAVLKMGKKPQILAVNDIGESCVATPAIADGRLFVRTVKKLYCFSESAK